MKSVLFATKSLEQLTQEADSETSGLKRVLGPWHLIFLGVGAIVGAGIFVITGHAAAQYAGPAVTLSFMLAGVTCAFAGLCYAEFASLIPIAGSAYTYAYSTLGELIAWIIGWDLILEYSLGATTVAIGWSGYVVSFLKDIGVDFPASLAAAPYSFNPQTGAWTKTGAVLNLPAAFVIAVVAYVLVRGIKESATVNSVIVFLKIGIILIFIGAGLFFIKPALWKPFIPPNQGQFGFFGLSGVLRGAGVMFFAYLGFDAVSTAAQEAKNPKRDMPIGILGSLFACTAIYIAFSLVLTGVVHYTQLNVPAPVAVAIDDGPAHGPAEDLLHHGQGRPPAPGGGPGPPEARYAPRHDHRHGHRCRGRGGHAPHRYRRRAGQYRDALRLRHRLRRSPRPPLHPSRHPAALQDPPRPLCPHHGHPVLFLLDVGTAQGHVAPAPRLDGAGAGHLFHLRHPKEQAETKNLNASASPSAPLDPLHFSAFSCAFAAQSVMGTMSSPRSGGAAGSGF
jgi:hypothetical protein